jgi:preprotein translocase subunit YajC
MDNNQESAVSLYLVFGLVVIGGIALFTRIREQMRRRKNELNTPQRDDEALYSAGERWTEKRDALDAKPTRDP